jgi:shikimate kinase
VNILIAGLRGAGKTTVGRALAERRRMPFIDLDDWSAAAAGCASPAEAIAHRGEAEFRRAEAGALRVALLYRGHVFALGGGTLTAPGVQRLVRDARAARHARLIYLRARPDTLRSRLISSDLTQRPSLTGAGTLEEMALLFAQRDPLYRDLADAVIDTDDLSPQQTLEALDAACADVFPAPA